MKTAVTILLILALGPFAYAASLKNRDSRQYHLEMRFPNGRVGRIIVPGNSNLSSFCSYDGCAVMLLETRDTAQVGPNDRVEIFYGRLQVRRSRFR